MPTVQRARCGGEEQEDAAGRPSSPDPQCGALTDGSESSEILGLANYG